ncbi:hypothetical protein C8F04DRAFT_1236303 [Mycena alexandri]|uniref:Uncharacterized protein n=1 Tax=Mycena alexandri TaxID=1745969 RepID=A0AAD6X3F4_9AGAR|nr:hypothetical protein C8F04DRAFT_1236303 [Mycena alexandri]
MLSDRFLIRSPGWPVSGNAPSGRSLILRCSELGLLVDTPNSQFVTLDRCIPKTLWPFSRLGCLAQAVPAVNPLSSMCSFLSSFWIMCAVKTPKNAYFGVFRFTAYQRGMLGICSASAIPQGLTNLGGPPPLKLPTSRRPMNHALALTAVPYGGLFEETVTRWTRRQPDAGRDSNKTRPSAAPLNSGVESIHGIAYGAQHPLTVSRPSCIESVVGIAFRLHTGLKGGVPDAVRYPLMPSSDGNVERVGSIAFRPESFPLGVHTVL